MTRTPSFAYSASFAMEEELELRALVDQAFDHRTSPYFSDAIGEIERWHDRRALRWLEDRDRRRALLIGAVRDTRKTAA
jgi:hypothetical protein